MERKIDLPFDFSALFKECGKELCDGETEEPLDQGCLNEFRKLTEGCTCVVPSRAGLAFLLEFMESGWCKVTFNS